MIGSLRDYREAWLCDFEFTAPPGECPDPICMVARELRSGRVIRLWRDVLHRLSSAPFPTDRDSLFVAFFATAELGCFLSLGWPLPARVLDLYAEFRNNTNGLELPCGRGLLGALAYYGLDSLGAAHKEGMRELAIRGGPYTDDERRDLLVYCESDVDALARLLPLMPIDWPRALLRGRYMSAVARMEQSGIPIYTGALAILREHWADIQEELISRIDVDYGIFDGRTFKRDRFAAWLIREGIPWPRLPSGELDLADDTFRQMARAYPKVSPIRELRVSLSQMRLADLAVGADGRNRCLLSPFQSITGRNQPSNSKFIFGPSTWIRSLIRPEEGRGLAYVDWSAQEFGIAAALSGDPRMLEDYRSGDPYLSLAIRAGAAPPDATKRTHGPTREQFKTCVLGVQYGMAERTLSERIGCSPAQGRYLIRKHREAYPVFWRWSDAAVDRAMLLGKLRAAFGWTVRVGERSNPRSLRNFPMQANGAEMLRLACIRATELGIRVCGPIHDALLVEAPADLLDDVVRETQRTMAEASELVLDGFRLRTDAKVIRHPERYSDPRGARMWETVWSVIGELTGSDPLRHAQGDPLRRGIDTPCVPTTPSNLISHSCLS